MANYTSNYNLIIPQVTDNVNTSTVPGIGNSNITIDTQIKSLHDEDAVLQIEITNNYTILDVKIDTEIEIVNHRVSNLILHSAPLPEVAAQQVYDACYSPVYDITFDVLTDRITNTEQEAVDLQAYVDTTINDAIIALQAQMDNYAMIIRCGGIA